MLIRFTNGAIRYRFVVYINDHYWYDFQFLKLFCIIYLEIQKKLTSYFFSKLILLFFFFFSQSNCINLLGFVSYFMVHFFRFLVTYVMVFNFFIFLVGYLCPPCGIRFSSYSTLEAHQTFYCSHRLKKISKGEFNFVFILLFT